MKSLPEYFIKICGLTQQGDVEHAITSGATAVGFIFAPSSRQVSIEQAQTLSNVAGSVIRVGVMKDLSEVEILDVVANVDLDAVQLHDEPNQTLVTNLRSKGLYVFAVHHQGGWLANSLSEYSALLIDNPVPGSGQQNDFSFVETLGLKIPVILAGGLNPENVGDAITEFRPYGVDVSSGVESSPGSKDLRKVSAFVTMALRAFEDQ